MWEEATRLGPSNSAPGIRTLAAGGYSVGGSCVGGYNAHATDFGWGYCGIRSRRLPWDDHSAGAQSVGPQIVEAQSVGAQSQLPISELGFKVLASDPSAGA